MDGASLDSCMLDNAYRCRAKLRTKIKTRTSEPLLLASINIHKNETYHNSICQILDATITTYFISWRPAFKFQEDVGKIQMALMLESAH